MKIATLSSLLRSQAIAAQIEVSGLASDSRQVKPGFLFAALRGAERDGRAFAGAAVAQGAVAILTDDPAALALDPDESRPVAIISDAAVWRRS